MPEYPILEFDNAREAMLEPARLIRPMDISPYVVVCFFQDVITKLAQRHAARVVKHLRSEIGTHPIYEMEFEGRRLTVFHPGIGAPLSAAMLEEVIALGGRKFIACGGAGVLDSSLAVGHVVVPTSAVRDEGVSYHYLPARPRSSCRRGRCAGDRGGPPKASLRICTGKDLDHRCHLSRDVTESAPAP